jgi:hypothetical protein
MSNIVTVIYPITRYSELKSEVQFDLSSDRDRIKFADPMHFYQDPLTEDEQNRILQAYTNGEIDDTWGYVKDYLIDRDLDPREEFARRFNEKFGSIVPNVTGVIRRSLMGDCQFYEGICRVGENRYEIMLGS